MKAILDGICNNPVIAYLESSRGTEVANMTIASVSAQVIMAQVRTTKGAGQTLMMKAEAAESKAAARVKKPKAPRDDNKPKKPQNGFMLWSGEMRRLWKKGNCPIAVPADVDGKTFSKWAGSHWSNVLTEEERKPYNDQYIAAMPEYEKKMAKYMADLAASGGAGAPAMPTPAAAPAPAMPTPAAAPAPAMPTPAAVPTPGLAAPGLPAPGLPAPGLAAPGLPAPGLAAPGLPAPGLPAPGLAAPGLPAPGAAPATAGLVASLPPPGL
jgi:hypothetical protein